MKELTREEMLETNGGGLREWALGHIAGKLTDYGFKKLSENGDKRISELKDKEKRKAARDHRDRSSHERSHFHSRGLGMSGGSGRSNR